MKEEYVTYRVYSLFTIAGDLSFRISRYTGKDDLFELAKFQGLGNPLYNGIAGATRIERAVVFGDQTVYIAVKGDNDHQYLPLALRCAKDMQQVSDLPIPKGSLPRDILVKRKNLLVLVSQKKHRQDLSQHGDAHQQSLFRRGDMERTFSFYSRKFCPFI